MKRKNKIWKRVFLSFFFLGMILFVLLESQVMLGYKNIKPAPSDVIIVLGCKLWGDDPSPLLEKRLQEGMRLYKKGYGKAIIVSGGQGRDEPIPEAAAMKNYLVSKGIPQEVIYTEEQSHNTDQNIEYSKKIMLENKWNEVVITTNTFHLYRAMKLAKDHGLQATGSPAPMTKEWTVTVYYHLREPVSLIKYYVLKMVAF